MEADLNIRHPFQKVVDQVQPLENGAVSKLETSIIVPAYNEEDALADVLADLVGIANDKTEIILVDDGSSDKTQEIAKQFPVELIIHETNQGKGAAMKTGVEHARGRKVVFIDADATYPVTAIPIIIEKLENYDLVRALRNQGFDNMPWVNRIGNHIFVNLVRMVHQIDGSDVLTGLYGLRAESIRKMNLMSNGFDIESEIVIKAATIGLRSTYIPIEYNERLGEKKLHPVSDGLVILRRILALAILYRPTITYVIPGLILWILALLGLLVFSQGPIQTSFAGFTTNTFIVTAMAFLAGFQLIVFGIMANLYATETGLGIPSRSLYAVAKKIPRTAGAIFSVLIILVGFFWTLSIILGWVLGGFGEFVDTEFLVLSMATIVWGVQLLCTMFILSLFAGLLRNKAQ